MVEHFMTLHIISLQVLQKACECKTQYPEHVIPSNINDFLLYGYKHK